MRDLPKDYAIKDDADDVSATKGDEKAVTLMEHRSTGKQQLKDN